MSSLLAGAALTVTGKVLYDANKEARAAKEMAKTQEGRAETAEGRLAAASSTTLVLEERLAAMAAELTEVTSKMEADMDAKAFAKAESQKHSTKVAGAIDALKKKLDFTDKLIAEQETILASDAPQVRKDAASTMLELAKKKRDMFVHQLAEFEQLQVEIETVAITASVKAGKEALQSELKRYAEAVGDKDAVRTAKESGKATVKDARELTAAFYDDDGEIPPVPGVLPVPPQPAPKPVHKFNTGVHPTCLEPDFDEKLTLLLDEELAIDGANFYRLWAIRFGRDFVKHPYKNLAKSLAVAEQRGVCALLYGKEAGEAPLTIARPRYR